MYHFPSDNGSLIPRIWNSKIQRRSTKKTFLASISLLFAKYRGKDSHNTSNILLQRKLDEVVART